MKSNYEPKQFMIHATATNSMYFSTARKRGKISHILKAFFIRHSSEYETSDGDGKVIQSLYGHMRIHMVR